MRLRSCVISAVLAWVALGCGSTEVEFEPLSEAGAASSAGTTGSAAGAAGSGGTGQAGSTALGGSAGASAAGMPSAAGAMVMGGSGGEGGSSDSGGTGGGETNGCAALVDWQLGPYQLGQRVLSTCLLPYNGTCPVNETHEFECQPPTGAVGLGWCTDRQPGVVNGWNEAWVMHGVCPVAR